MERKLTKVVDGTEIIETGKMCSCGTDVVDNLCSWECPDTCGMRNTAPKDLGLNSLNFREGNEESSEEVRAEKARV